MHVPFGFVRGANMLWRVIDVVGNMGYKEFIKIQLEALTAFLHGKDVFVSLQQIEAIDFSVKILQAWLTNIYNLHTGQ